MGAILIVVVMALGQVGVALAVPQVDMSVCEQALVATRMDTNMPGMVEVVDAKCMTKTDFLKMIGEQET